MLKIYLIYVCLKISKPALQPPVLRNHVVLALTSQCKRTSSGHLPSNELCTSHSRQDASNIAVIDRQRQAVILDIWKQKSISQETQLPGDPIESGDDPRILTQKRNTICNFLNKRFTVVSHQAFLFLLPSFCLFPWRLTVFHFQTVFKIIQRLTVKTTPHD